MDVGSLLLGLALLLLVAFIAARPLFEQEGLPEQDIRPADRLIAEREALLTALRDLDFDHATGKIGDEDYTPQRAQLAAQGVAVLKQLDLLGPASAEDEIERAVAARRRSSSAARAPAAPRAAQSVDDLIEAEVAARRRPSAEGRRAALDERPALSPGQVTCPHCGALTNPGERFCSKCGHILALACPECGRPVQPDDRFCAACGAKLQPAEASG